MMTFLRAVRSCLIFVVQLVGALMIADGLRMIWPPVSVIYCGVSLILFGHRVYCEAESEERKT